MSEERFLISTSGKLNVDDTLFFLCQLCELAVQVHSNVGDVGTGRVSELPKDSLYMPNNDLSKVA